jgi:hypothetical protein
MFGNTVEIINNTYFDEKSYDSILCESKNSNITNSEYILILDDARYDKRYLLEYIINDSAKNNLTIFFASCNNYLLRDDKLITLFDYIYIRQTDDSIYEYMFPYMSPFLMSSEKFKKKLKNYNYMNFY